MNEKSDLNEKAIMKFLYIEYIENGEHPDVLPSDVTILTKPNPLYENITYEIDIKGRKSEVILCSEIQLYEYIGIVFQSSVHKLNPQFLFDYVDVPKVLTLIFNPPKIKYDASECPVCLNEFPNEHYLDCGHKVCGCCFANLATTPSLHFCPVCRSPFACIMKPFTPEEFNNMFVNQEEDCIKQIINEDDLFDNIGCMDEFRDILGYDTENNDGEYFFLMKFI